MNVSSLITTISSRIVYNNPWITVREDDVIHPSGEKGIYGFVETLPTVGIVPLEGFDFVWLCQQYRYIFKDYSWEIPRGFANANEDISLAAHRELAEEAGFVSTNMIRLGGLRLSSGILNEEAQVYLARDIKRKRSKQDNSEIISVQKFSMSRIHTMIKDNRIKDGLTIGSLSLVMEFLHANI